MSDANRAIEVVARQWRGKIVALLAARSGNLAAAEDAFSSALVKALEVWPLKGVPEHPERWLVAVARRIQIDAWRVTSRNEAIEDDQEWLGEDRDPAGHPFPDERMKLLFVCAHPAIDERIRAPLMLQTVLGLDSRRIASPALVAPSAMAQRLSRAKAKIRDCGIRFEIPEEQQLKERVGSVLDAIYAAYTLGWGATFTDDSKAGSLAEEALWLARLVAEQLPREPEALGLLALILFCEARRKARRDAEGDFIPLHRQDSSLWDEAMTASAEGLLRRSGLFGAPGRYQWEAAIQSVHADRRRSGRTNWDEITALYEALATALGTVGVRVGHAAALLESRGAAACIAALDGMGTDLIGTYQPYWAVRAHAVARMGDRAEANRLFEKAAGLAEDGAVRMFLLKQRA